MDREARWNRISIELQLPADIYRLENDAVVCIPCNGKRLRTLSTRSIRRHNECAHHTAAMQHLAADDNIAARWERIRALLGLQEDIYTLVDNHVECICCNVQLTCLTAQKIRRHDETPRHQTALRLWRTVPRPSVFARTASSSRMNAYWMDLTGMLLDADIPIDKVGNPSFRNFMERNTRQKLPDTSTLRRTYVPCLYDHTIEPIRQEIGESCIHLGVDETKDSIKRIVVSAIVTPLTNDGPGMPRLIHVDRLEAANAQTICGFVESALMKLWPNGIHRDRLLMYATDGAPYMVLSARVLKNNRRFRKLVHIRCMCHGLHLVVGKIREEYQDVDNLIAWMKKKISNSPNRINILRDVAPELPLPPTPILTRWCTWIEACEYYDTHFDILHEVMDAIEFGNEAARIMNVRQLLESPEIAAQLEEITEKFTCLSETTRRLEARNLSLNTSLEILTNAVNRIMEDDHIADPVKAKMTRVIERNTGLQQMINVNDCVRREIFDSLPPQWTVEDAVATTHASLTTVDVERSFSKFKSLFRDNRQSFTFENLRRHLVVNYFSSGNNVQ